ncbi:protein THEM6 [Bicyclus anynana]|uniref:Protein THEM6 n=1 Tax=Bicyclus anynana TaxID=110368 RepID=A0A6J1MQD6_BICAN|nr:protein THEM6 [Bicyclus anynana]
MLVLCIIFVTAIVIVTLFYVFCDVNYFIRMGLTVLISKIFQKKSGIKDPITIYGFCTTQDVDFLLNHMNNARYIRELDFARVNFYIRTGIYAHIKAIGGDVLQGATNIRYRRTISIFKAYKIETKLTYWEDKSLFFEHKFITFDGFVRTVVLSRQNLINVDAETLMKSIPGAESKPECPEEIKHWIQAMEVSSAKLRHKN